MRGLPFIAGLLLLIAGNTWISAQTLDVLQEQLQSSQSLVNELEDSHGRDNLRLAEPLAQLADQLMALGLHADAHRTLDRAMQIVRINDGLYTRAQLPLLQKKIVNLANWGDWDAARIQLEHQLWFYRTKSRRADQQLVEDLQLLANMHLRGVTEDGIEQQSYHLRRAMSSNGTALAVGEAIWGKTDPRLSPLLYTLVKLCHLHIVAINQSGRTGYELRQAAPGADWVRKPSEMRRFYYFTGVRLLNQIKSMYSASAPMDQEGLAMVNLYIADWQVLNGRESEALVNYQLAYTELEQAGVDHELIQAYFSQPALLPESRFYPSVHSALAARENSELSAYLDVPDDAMNALFYEEWGSAFPYVSRPSELSYRLANNSNFALFSFNLAGVADIQSFINGLSSDPFSRVQAAELVETEVESTDQEQRLLQRLSWLRFRPKLENGVPQQAVATLRYLPALELIE